MVLFVNPLKIPVFGLCRLEITTMNTNLFLYQLEMNAARRQRSPIPLEVSCQIRALHQIGGMRGSELVRRFPQYSAATLYRHAKKPLDGTDRVDRRHGNKGRPRKLGARDVRLMKRQIAVLREQYGTFSSRRLQLSCSANHVR